MLSKYRVNRFCTYYQTIDTGTVKMDSWSEDEKSENVVSIASLMLHDDGAEISAENISKVIKASGNVVEAYWPALFSKMLTGNDVSSLLKASELNYLICNFFNSGSLPYAIPNRPL